MTVILDGARLRVADVVAVARAGEDVALADSARERLISTRAHLDTYLMSDDAPLFYAFNTGVGLFKDRRVMVADQPEYQVRLINAHATGVGEPYDREVVRATMLVRANALAVGSSGPSVVVVERLVDFLNAGLHPVIPCRGSVGASGDLAPLAHLAAGLGGFAEAFIEYGGRQLPARQAIAACGLPVDFAWAAKDAAALINGSAVSAAIGALAVHDARRALRSADVALAMTLEALRGELDAFHPAVFEARPHPGHGRTARNVLKVVAGTRRCTAQARAAAGEQRPRVQDSYSLRCAPQVHGAVHDALDYIERVLEIELNSATDNPLIVEGATIISGGNFHGQPVAQVMDLLAIAATDLGSISERRMARLIDPALNHGLPPNLTAGREGLNTGFANVQCAMSALVMENRTLAAPGSVDSIPGKGNAEDHVSNSAWCARKARTVVANVEQIIAAEVLLACQALDLQTGLDAYPLGYGTRAAVDTVRRTIPPALDGDRWFHADLSAALTLITTGAMADGLE